MTYYLLLAVCLDVYYLCPATHDPLPTPRSPDLLGNYQTVTWVGQDEGLWPVYRHTGIHTGMITSFFQGALLLCQPNNIPQNLAVQNKIKLFSNRTREGAHDARSSMAR